MKFISLIFPRISQVYFVNPGCVYAKPGYHNISVDYPFWFEGSDKYCKEEPNGFVHFMYVHFCYRIKIQYKLIKGK